MLRFDEKLPLESKGPIPDGMRPGPCAMGPAEQALLSMHVWIFQPTESGAAVASGDNREQPLTGRPGPSRWRVVTALDPKSEEFSPGKPAVAMAMAIVRPDEGPLEVQHWSQAVIVTDEGDVRDPGAG